MLIRRLLFRCILWIPVVLFLNRCANPVSPQGGPKDITPPRMISSTPENYSTNVTDNEIRINFNEFIQLKDQAKQIYISPPSANFPDVKVKGKSLQISFEDSLLQSQTYTINFGNSVCDITEGNPTKDFRFVFSTGDFIDSLSLEGKVINSFDRTPQKEILVMIYSNSNDTLPVDSLPLYVPPSYQAVTDEDGNFILENINNDRFLLFALRDQNSNGIFDMPNEKIAFLDTLVSGTFHPEVFFNLSTPDSIGDSSARVIPDSSISSSVKHPFYTLKLFEETDSIQKIKRVILQKKGQIVISFRFPTSDPSFTPLNISADSLHLVKEISQKKDTAMLWFSEVPADSLILELSDHGKPIDTIRICLSEKSKKKKKDHGTTEVPERLVLSTNIRNEALNPFRNNPTVTFSYPVSRANLSRLMLIREKDTLPVSSGFTDSVKRTLMIKHPWKEDKKYKILIPDSVFFSQPGMTNDSLQINFRTRMMKDYGSVKMIITGTDSLQQNIIQLLTDNGTIIEEKIITGTGKADFVALNPGKYKLKCIIDRNKNGRWDTGNFRRKIQPEEVEYFPRTIEIRANWDIEESWKIKSGVF